MTQDLIATVRALFEDLAAGGDMGLTLEKYLHEDCIWENTGCPTAPHRAACMALIRAMRDKRGAAALSADFLDIGLSENGSVVTERIDYIWTADGKLLFDLPVMGILEFRNGLVGHWREYFDPTLPTLSAEVISKIGAGDLSWKDDVSPSVVDLIVKRGFFNYESEKSDE